MSTLFAFNVLRHHGQRAEDLATHRVLVIKLSYLSHMRAGRAMDNPLREVCMLSRLGQHENIAKLVEASFDVEKHVRGT